MRRLTPATVLIVLIFAAASVLAWQAYQSAQSHRQSAERVLNDYVQFAGWEFARLSQASLENAMSQWGQPVAASASSPLWAPAEFNARSECKCNDLRATTLFRLMGNGFVTTGEPLTRATEQWLTRLADAPHGSQLHGRHAVRIEAGGEAIRAVVARTAYVPGGRAMSLEGFVMDGRPVQRVFSDIVTRRPLLPPTLAGTRNELLAVLVRTPDGGEVYASPGAAGEAAARLTGTLDEAFGGLRYEVALQPEAASRLVIGGLPRSRLPVLLGLLALTGALAIAALLQLRREHQLASIRSDFVSSVSHELRTPLAQIRLFSETLLLNRIRSEAEGRRALEIIQQESRRLTHLVENVLFFSRSERGVERVSPRPLALAPLATELVDAFLPLARSGRSEVRVDVHDAVDAHVDPAAFRQILLNLLDNAVKYGRADQTIVVGIARRGESAALSVADQGPGVPPDARGRIFAPYSRLVTASSSAVAGTGIGLAVVRELVRLHGGSIRVEDAPGGGASFVVEFRLAHAAHPSEVDLAARSLPA
jgi:signal transduction histidine kinase